MAEKSSRKTSLQIWLIEQDITLRSIAEQMGISRQRCGFLLNSASITPQMHARFVAVGVPALLLPPVEKCKCGPDRRKGTLCLNPATVA